MGAGEWLEAALRGWRRRRDGALPGPLGDFHRAGGRELIERHLPLRSEALAIDAGGYLGAWTAAVLCRYGCRSIVFEPAPGHCAQLRDAFGKNERVEIVEAALGAADGQARLRQAADGTSAFRGEGEPFIARQLDAARVVSERR